MRCESFEQFMNPLESAVAPVSRAALIENGPIRRTTVLLSMLLASVCMLAITNNADAGVPMEQRWK